MRKLIKREKVVGNLIGKDGDEIDEEMEKKKIGRKIIKGDNWRERYEKEIERKKGKDEELGRENN